jgi:GAF domain-containing protein
MTRLRCPSCAPDALTDPYISRAWAPGAGLRWAILQPVVRDDETVAVLVVGWRKPIRSLSQPAAMSIGLLADEAAGALERAELIGRLRDLSRRDALTGLPNRRAWD